MFIGVQTCVNVVSCFDFTLYSSVNPCALIKMTEREIIKLQMWWNGTFTPSLPERLPDNLRIRLDFEKGVNSYKNLTKLKKLQAKTLIIEVYVLPELDEHAKHQWQFSQNAAQVIHVEADVYH